MRDAIAGADLADLNAELWPTSTSPRLAATASPGSVQPAPAPSSPARRRAVARHGRPDPADLRPGPAAELRALPTAPRTGDPHHAGSGSAADPPRPLGVGRPAAWARAAAQHDLGAHPVHAGPRTARRRGSWRAPSTGPTTAPRRPEEIGHAEMDVGSVLVYTGTVFHGGGANTTDHDRIGLNITYALGWLRQEENQYLSCPPDVARTLDPELQGLLGYATGQYAVGYYTPPLPPGEGPELVPPEQLRCVVATPARSSGPAPAATPCGPRSPRRPPTDAWHGNGDMTRRHRGHPAGAPHVRVHVRQWRLRRLRRLVRARTGHTSRVSTSRRRARRRCAGCSTAA